MDTGSKKPLGSAFSRRSVLKAMAVGAVAKKSLFPSPALASEPIIKIGYISSVTGLHAPFAEADHFLLSQAREALKNGITNNGKTYQVEIIDLDDQTNPDRATSAVQKLINKDEVNLVLAQGALGIKNVSAQCELAGVPSITTMDPWQSWLFPQGGKPETGFTYANHFFWGIEDIISTYVGMWSGLDTNKKIASCWTNDPPGQTFFSDKIGFPPALKAAGFEMVDIGLFEPGSNDFTRQIAAFRDAGCDIMTGIFDPPDWIVFWRQAKQAGFTPKVATIAKALLFPAGVQALGADANGMSTEVWWSPDYPFTSSINGKTCRDLASTYEKETRRPWTQPIGVIHALHEAGIHALRTAEDPLDGDSVAKTIKTSKVDTVVGTLDWGGSPVKSVAKMVIGGAQWKVDSSGKLDLDIVYNKAMPQIPVTAPFQMKIGA